MGQINTQIVPPSEALISKMPSGRDIHLAKQYQPPNLDEDTLANLRAPPSDIHQAESVEDDDSSSSEAEEKGRNELPGTFPGSSVRGSNDNAYY